MNNPIVLFFCLICKKFKSHSKLEMMFKDGSLMCTECGDEVRGGCSCYIHGKEILVCDECDGTGYNDDACILPYTCDVCPMETTGECQNKCPKCEGTGKQCKEEEDYYD